MTKKFGLKSSSRSNFNKQSLLHNTSTTKLDSTSDQMATNNTIAPSELDQLAKVKWNSLQTDLAQALGTWNELNETNEKSPEEKQLEKVKTLIEDLKSKLNEF
ncbi:MAG: hypothetical protein ACK4VO_09920 [Pseudobdellovibrio sp.]